MILISFLGILILLRASSRQEMFTESYALDISKEAIHRLELERLAVLSSEETIDKGSNTLCPLSPAKLEDERILF